MAKNSKENKKVELVPPLGAHKSPYDIRTFTYPTKATGISIVSGGKRYNSSDIEDQGRVGICTSIHLTQNARKATGVKYSADFLYLLQKKFFDSQTRLGWSEGSSIFHAIKAAHKFGLLPEKYWKHTKMADRQLPYEQYIQKLRAIPESEIQRLLGIAEKHKVIKAYARVPVDRDTIADAIFNSRAGVLTRFVVGKEWWTSVDGKTSWKASDIEPLRPPKKPVSGHAVTTSDFNQRMFRVANTWSAKWADKGTASYIIDTYTPTECWSIWYRDLDAVPKEIDEKLRSRKETIGQIMNLLQKVISLLAKLA